MITIPRAVARQLAKVFRIALALTPAQAARQPVSIDSEEQGVTFFSQTKEFGIRYRWSGASDRERCVVPLGLFRTVGGARPDPVTILRARDQVLQAQWQDGDVPQQAEWPEPSAASLSEGWSAPTRWAKQDGQLLQAMADATATTDQESSRYALSCLQLRGARGEIAATDGRQVLLQSGFEFAWEDDVLIRGSKLFGYTELRRFSSTRIGRTDPHVALEFGEWCFWIAIEQEGRFPRVDDIVPRVDFATTFVTLDPGDVRFLAENLRRLPAQAGVHVPTTIDLNGTVAVRARSEDDLHVTELVLTNSTRTGEQIRFVTDQRYLQRAADMGFPKLYANSPQSPVLCQDDRRKYFWALWSPEDAVKPQSDMTCISTPQVQTSKSHRRTGSRSRPRCATPV